MQPNKLRAEEIPSSSQYRNFLSQNCTIGVFHLDEEVNSRLTALKKKPKKATGGKEKWKKKYWANCRGGRETRELFPGLDFFYYKNNSALVGSISHLKTNSLMLVVAECKKYKMILIHEEVLPKKKKKKKSEENGDPLLLRNNFTKTCTVYTETRSSYSYSSSFFFQVCLISPSSPLRTLFSNLTKANGSLGQKMRTRENFTYISVFG